jgi:hypothetical protein
MSSRTTPGRIPLMVGQERPANLAQLLRETFVALNDLVLAALAERGHTAVRPTHSAVFQYLDDTGTTVSLLAERAQMTKQAMAELVRHLEDHGYVTRVPDPTDGRAKLVLPTHRRWCPRSRARSRPCSAPTAHAPCAPTSRPSAAPSPLHPASERARPLPSRYVPARDSLRSGVVGQEGPLRVAAAVRSRSRHDRSVLPALDVRIVPSTRPGAEG